LHCQDVSELPNDLYLVNLISCLYEPVLKSGMDILLLHDIF